MGFLGRSFLTLLVSLIFLSIGKSNNGNYKSFFTKKQVKYIIRETTMDYSLYNSTPEGTFILTEHSLCDHSWGKNIPHEYYDKKLNSTELFYIQDRLKEIYSKLGQIKHITPDSIIAEIKSQLSKNLVDFQNHEQMIPSSTVNLNMAKEEQILHQIIDIICVYRKTTTVCNHSYEPSALDGATLDECIKKRTEQTKKCPNCQRQSKEFDIIRL